ncbi:MAG: hypothetical protein KF680_07210 [Cryobacterium sp.]|nr:hypothetical protein [Cryobacterium sp.]
MTTLSDGVTTVTPLQVLGYEADRRGQNITHELVDGDVAISLRRAQLRKGNLELLFDDRATAFTCLTMHSRPARLTLSEDDLSEISMQYVVDGELRISLDPSTQTAWTVRVGFREVT